MQQAKISLFPSSLQEALFRNHKTRKAWPESLTAQTDAQIRAVMQIILGRVFMEDQLSISQYLFLPGIFN